MGTPGFFRGSGQGLYNTYGSFRLSAKAHESTDHEPWIAIVPDWTAMGSQVLGYAVERRPYGQTYFVEIDRTGLRIDYEEEPVPPAAKTKKGPAIPDATPDKPKRPPKTSH